MLSRQINPVPLWKRLMLGATFGLLTSRKLRSMPVWKRVVLAIVLGLGAVALYRSVRAEMHRNSLAVVRIEGTQHIGPNFNIAGFYVNGYEGGIVGREGFSGEMCCVSLPKKWRPDLVVEVRWAVGDWSNENRAEIDAENYKSITYTCFKATVPIQKYDVAERVFVHFFSEGRVRVVTSKVGVLGDTHPIRRNDMHAVESSTSGQRINSIFTDAEIAEMDRQHDNRNTFFGDWR